MKMMWKTLYSIPFLLILYGMFFMRHRDGGIDYWLYLVILEWLVMSIITTFQRIFLVCEHIVFTREIIHFFIIVILVSFAFDEVIFWLIPMGSIVLGYFVGSKVGKILKTYIDTN